MRNTIGCTDIGPTSDPPCWSIPSLQYSYLPGVNILQVYGHKARSTHYPKKHLERLGKKSFSQAWGAIAATHFLDGLPNPKNSPETPAYTELDRYLAHHLKIYGIEDPHLKREKASPLGIVQSIVDTAATATNPKTSHTANLVQLGFYFCLSSCEYKNYIRYHHTVQ